MNNFNAMGINMNIGTGTPYDVAYATNYPAYAGMYNGYHLSYGERVTADTGMIVPEGIPAQGEVLATPDMVNAVLNNTPLNAGVTAEATKSQNPTKIMIKAENQPIQVAPFPEKVISTRSNYTMDEIMSLFIGYFRIACKDIESGYITGIDPATGDVMGRIYINIDNPKIADDDERIRCVSRLIPTNNLMEQVMQISYLQKRPAFNITQHAVDIFSEFLVGFNLKGNIEQQIPFYIGDIQVDRRIDNSGYIFYIDKINVTKVLRKLIFQDTAGNPLDVRLQYLAPQHNDPMNGEFIIDIVNAKRAKAMYGRINPGMNNTAVNRPYCAYSGNADINGTVGDKG